MTKPISRKLAVDCLLDRVMRQFGEPLRCSVDNEPLLPGQAIQFDHIHSDIFGGAHEYQNLRPIHYDPCHKGKTRRDAKDNAKLKRILDSKQSKRPMQNSGAKIPKRADPWGKQYRQAGAGSIK